MKTNIAHILSILRDRKIQCAVQQGKLVTKAPTGSIDPILGDLITENKQALIEAIQNQKPCRYDEKQTIGAQVPASIVQQQLWTHEHFSAAQNSYILPLAFTLNGPLDDGALTLAVKDIVARHWVLSSHYRLGSQGLVQERADVSTLQINKIDLSQQQVDKQDIADAISADVFKPFDLETSLPIRATHWKIGDEEHVLVFSFHHIAMDGWSLAIFQQEMLEAYMARVENRTANLPPLSLSYSDYSRWQRTYIDSVDYQQSLAYWIENLRGAPIEHGIPLDFRRDHSQLVEAGRIESVWSAQLLAQINAFCSAHNITIFMFLHGVLSILIAKVGQQNDIIVGAPFASRMFEELEPLIGHFVNLLPLRTTINHSQRIGEYFKEIRDINLAAQNNQLVPLENIIDALQIPRSAHVMPLIQMLLSVEHQSSTIDRDSQTFPIKGQPSKFDLSLTAKVFEHELKLTFEYEASVFSQAQITTLIDQLQSLTTQVLQSTNCRIEQLHADGPLSSNHSCSILAPLNKINSVASAIELVQHQSMIRSDEIALVYGQQSLTYAQLIEKVNTIAAYLKDFGAAKNQRVVVLLSDPLDAVLTFLAIAKTGAAYVPIDDQPSSRIHQLIAEVEPILVVGDPQLIDQYTLKSVLPHLNLCGFDELMQADKQDAEFPHIEATDAAYVMFTSGTSGSPKGVVISHSSIVNLISGNNPCPLNSDTVLAQTGSLAFDAATFEIWGTLSHGGRLVLIDPSSFDLSSINQCLIQHSVNTMWMTVGLFSNWSRHLPHDIHALEHIIFGGDVISHRPVAEVMKRFPQLNLYNGYGPTENTTFSYMHKLSETDLSRQTLPIGQPLDGVFGVIVDTNLLPVADGAVGELCLLGNGLSLGYFEQPELTAVKFINLLTEQGKSIRAYRTGDLVRKSATGDISFIRRADDQVKVSGFRIEPNEINAVLTQVEGVKDALTMAVSHDDQKYLVSYLLSHRALSRQAQASLISDAQHATERHLPTYMHPNGFKVITAWPLNQNGKIDRTALPTISMIQETAQIELPATLWENRVTEIWRNLLPNKSNNVSVSQSFFEQGGNSLLAMRLIADISKKWCANLTLRDFLRNNTIRSLALLVEDQHLDNAPIIEHCQNRATYPLSKAQQRLWFLQQWNASSGNYNVPFAYQFDGNFDVDAANRALTFLANRHVTLRSKVLVSDDGTASMRISAPLSAFPWQVIDTSGQNLEQQQQLLTAEKARQANMAFNLIDDLPMRAILIRCSQERHILLITFHHIAVDGWSMDILANDFSSAYQQTQATDLNGEITKQISFADYAAWEAKQLNNGYWDAQIKFWEAQLQNVPTLHSLPIRSARKDVADLSATTLTKTFSGPSLSELRNFAQHQGLSWFTFLHGVFSLAVSRFSHSQMILSGSPVAMRDHPQLQNVVGMMVNTLVFKSNCDETLSVKTYFEQLNEMHNAVLANKDIPFEKLVEIACSDLQSGYPPLVQIVFSAEQNSQSSELDFKGAKVKAEALALEQGKFELALHITDLEDSLELTLSYASELFEPDMINSLGSHVVHLLNNFEPNQPLGHWGLEPVSCRAEANESLISSECLLSAINRFADTHPNLIAVADETTQLCYRDLRQMANRARTRLLGQPLADNSVVAVALSKSTLQSALMIGIWASDSIYVPLDLSLPADRVATILNDAKPSLIICEQNQVSHFSEMGFNAMSLSSFFALGKPSDDNLTRLATDLPAYILYTSGSTGVPKGVMVNLDALSMHLFAVREHYKIKSTDRVLQFANLSFDASIEQIGVSLASGATSILYDTSIQGIDSDGITQFLLEQKITVAHFTPTYFSEVLHTSDWDKQFKDASLQCLIVGGEALLPNLVSQWFASTVSEHCRLVNSYGPTETVITCTACDITPDDEHCVPLGTVIGHRDLAIVNGCGRQVIPYMCGELVVMGQGLATGYWNKKEESEKRFKLLDAAEPTKSYLTGDVVRLFPDGRINYLGRADNQVKIRGYRVELSEIEHALGKHPSVKAARPFVTKSSPSQLVCFVELMQPQVGSLEQELRDWLANKLPHYMIPSVWHQVTQWPKTVNGKVDLAAIMIALPTQQPSFIPLQTNTEKTIANLWGSLLEINVESIGRDSHFFKLGGHSLLAMRMTFLLNQTCNSQLTVTDIFRYSSLQPLAAKIDQSELQTATQMIPNISAERNRFPLSPAQFRIWFVEHLQTFSSDYNMPYALRITGKFNPDAAKGALRCIVQKHQILRTMYQQSAQHNDVEQVITDDTHFIVQTLDLSTVDDLEKDNVLREVVQQESSTPFSLDLELPIRCTLVALASDQWVLLITLHHIACDGWSLELLEKDFLDFYSYIENGAPAPSSTSLIQYADYAVWQQDQLKTEQFKRKQVFWTDYLADAPLLHSLPTQKRRGSDIESAPALSLRQLSTASNQNYASYCEEHELTPFMFLFGLASMTISHFSHQKDVVIGTPFSNRTHQDVEQLVGCFVNTLPIRTTTQNNQPIDVFWEHVKSVLLQVQDNQDFPFESIVDLVNPPRDSRTSPIFQILFSYQKIASTSFSDDLDFALEPLDSSYIGSANKYEITIAVTDDEHGLSIAILYDKDRFAAEFIDKLHDYYIKIINGICNVSSQMNIGEMMYQIQAAQGHAANLTSDWQSKRQYHTVKGLLTASTTNYPEGVALQYEKTQITYSQLAEYIQEAKNYLADYGLAKGDRLAVILPRCPQYIVLAVAAMELGIIFVPICPSLPVKRIETILLDSAPSLAICAHKHAVVGIAYLDFVAIQDLEAKSSITSNIETVNPDPCDTAYILYTSGSTGTPKGVEVSQDALTNLIEQTCKQMIDGPKKQWLWLANVGFDISFYEWMGALHTGGKLVIAPQEISDDSLALAEFIPTSIDVLQMTPSRMQLMLDIGWLPQSHQTILLAGEPITTSLQAKLASACYSVWNGYGPTEATIYSMLNETSLYADAPSSVAMGKGVANYRHYICDEHLNLLPEGAIGELCISGPGVAQGYRNKPEATQDRFLVHPTLGRVYRSGDLVRFGEDGLVHYLGRIDSQTKINGHRVELGEIEAGIALDTSVETAVVLKTSLHQLVAFVVTDEQSFNEATLREELKALLPNYMQPNQILTISDVPLTANGKVNKQVLLRIAEESVPKGGKSPSSNLGKVLCLLWNEQLQREQIFVDDDFFVSGGHSVSATRLVNKINSIFKSGISLRQFFDASRPEDIEAVLSRISTSDVIAATYLDIMSLSEIDVARALNQRESLDQNGDPTK